MEVELSPVRLGQGFPDLPGGELGGALAIRRPGRDFFPAIPGLLRDAWQAEARDRRGEPDEIG
jgi:hypothetical protein